MHGLRSESIQDVQPSPFLLDIGLSHQRSGRRFAKQSQEARGLLFQCCHRFPVQSENEGAMPFWLRFFSLCQLLKSFLVLFQNASSDEFNLFFICHFNFRFLLQINEKVSWLVILEDIYLTAFLTSLHCF